MAERKAREVTQAISAELVAERDEQRSREGGITRRLSGRASLDPDLEKAREATLAREAELKGRSARAPIITR